MSTVCTVGGAGDSRGKFLLGREWPRRINKSTSMSRADKTGFIAVEMNPLPILNYAQRKGTKKPTSTSHSLYKVERKDNKCVRAKYLCWK